MERVTMIIVVNFGDSNELQEKLESLGRDLSKDPFLGKSKNLESGFFWNGIDYAVAQCACPPGKQLKMNLQFVDEGSEDE